MSLKQFLEEAVVRGEQFKTQVVSELLRSQTIKELVGNRYFIKAVSRMIDTKEEVSKSVHKQIKTAFTRMDVPTKKEIRRIFAKIAQLEKVVDGLMAPEKKAKKTTKKKTTKKKQSKKSVKRKAAKKAIKTKKTAKKSKPKKASRKTR